MKTKILSSQKKIHFQPLEFSCEKKRFQQTLFCSRLHLSGNKNTRRSFNVDFLFSYRPLSFNLIICWFSLCPLLNWSHCRLCFNLIWWGRSQCAADEALSFLRIPTAASTDYGNHKRNHHRLQEPQRRPVSSSKTREKTCLINLRRCPLSSDGLSITYVREISCLKASSFPHVIARKKHFKCRSSHTKVFLVLDCFIVV